MNYHKLVEEVAGLAQPGDKYLWYDADTIIYLAALVDARLDLPLDCAEHVIRNCMAGFLGKAKKTIGDDNLIVVPCLSVKDTFRHEIMESYKSNRIGKWRPPLLNHYRNVFKEMYNCIIWDKHEADDIVATLHWQIPGNICCSSDKDLKQVPGLLYNPRTDILEFITHEDALYHRVYQWVVGDSADGYKGCYLIGDKKAGKIIDPYFGSEDINLEELILKITEVYAIQNTKAIEKGKEFSDILQQFAVSQLRTEYTDSSLYLPNPLSYLQSFLEAGQVTSMDSQG